MFYFLIYDDPYMYVFIFWENLLKWFAYISISMFNFKRNCQTIHSECPHHPCLPPATLRAFTALQTWRHLVLPALFILAIQVDAGGPVITFSLSPGDSAIPELHSNSHWCCAQVNSHTTRHPLRRTGKGWSHRPVFKYSDGIFWTPGVTKWVCKHQSLECHVSQPLPFLFASGETLLQQTTASRLDLPFFI